MINLKDGKLIKRRVVLSTDCRIEPRRSDYGIMTVYPDGHIGFKKRGMEEIVVSIPAIYCRAVEKSVGTIRKTRKVSRGLLSTFGVKG